MKPAERHLDSVQVMARFGISKPTLYRWMNDPDLAFPKPLRIKRRYYFPEGAIAAWEREHGKIPGEDAESVAGCAVVSGVIQSYDDFVRAMASRRRNLAMTCIEVEMVSGMQEGYTTKLENWERGYGRGMGPETFPLWLGGLRLGIVLVDLPRRPRKPRKAA